MPRPMITRLLCSAALVALIPSAPGIAQTAGFAVELTPPGEFYFSDARVGVRLSGPVVEPAASYVRGCQGFVMAETGGARFEVTETFGTLAFTTLGEGVTGMVLGTPDGLYRCALARPDGLVISELANAAPGPYAVWLTGPEGATLSARLFAATVPLSRIDIVGLDTAALGAPRAGTHVFTGETPRQVLADGARVVGQDSFAPLNRDYCPGYGLLDAADAVLTLDAAIDRLSVLAMSNHDLTIAVRTPRGQVLCNDDAYGLDPAITVEGAAAGDYHIFVGTLGAGGEATFLLAANAGAPAFSDAVYVEGAEPRVARVTLDPAAAVPAGQRLAMGSLVSDDSFELLPSGQYCAGYGGIGAPDVVVTVDAAQAMLSLYAMSDSDLTLAVRGPDGLWLCNDDAYALNPGVTFNGAPAGEYAVYVGAYSQGTQDRWSLMAALGEPVWTDAPNHGFTEAPLLDVAAEPAVARLAYGPQTRIDPRVIFDISASQTEAWPLGDGCAGYVDVSRPDIVVTAEFGLPQLMVYLVSDTDGVLVVVGPDGTVHCNDDFEGLNPAVMIANPEPGDYAVFSGTYGGSGGVATLGVTIAAPNWVMDREH